MRISLRRMLSHGGLVMSYVKFLLPFLLLLLVGCQDDLNPSGEDQRPTVETGILGYQVGQIAPDFTVESTTFIPYTLTSELAANDGIVLYFTMWCPICDSHMSHMRATYVNNYPGVQFFVVDYVNGTLSASRSAQVANGYADMTVLADVNDTIENRYNGTMGSTIVIDRNGIVQMNQDYSDGSKLGQVLRDLP